MDPYLQTRHSDVLCTNLIFASFPKSFFLLLSFLLKDKGLGLVGRSNLPAFVAMLQQVLILLTWAFPFCLLKVDRLVSA